MYKINVVGLGPGSVNYILPIARELIESADLLIGSRRSLELFRDKKCFIYEKNLSEMLNVINSEKATKKIAVVVTGDTGFYSLLDFLNKHLPETELVVTPGISSFQYMFSQLKKSYKDYGLFSLHGRQANLVELLTVNKKIFLLTDSVYPPKVIAKELTKAGFGNAYMAVGENLSYADECISEGSIYQFTERNFKNLCVVVIEHEMVQ